MVTDPLLLAVMTLAVVILGLSKGALVATGSGVRHLKA